MFEEFLIVFGESKAPWHLAWGSVLAAAMLLLVDHMASLVEFEGILAPLTSAFQEVLHERYGKAALVILSSSFVAAWRSYRKTRKRMCG